MHAQKTQNHGTGTKIMHAGMWICCAVMVLPLLVFFAGGGTISGLSTSLGVLAPILLCLAAHGVMFLFMGKSCHGTRQPSDALSPEKRAEPQATDA